MLDYTDLIMLEPL